MNAEEDKVGEATMGICDVARHSKGWVTIAPGVKHTKLPDCENWRPIEPAPVQHDYWPAYKEAVEKIAEKEKEIERLTQAVRNSEEARYEVGSERDSLR